MYEYKIERKGKFGWRQFPRLYSKLSEVKAKIAKEQRKENHLNYRVMRRQVTDWEIVQE